MVSESIRDGYKKTELGEMPEEWEVNTLEDVCAKAINGGTPSTEIEKYWEGDIPWITGADILNQKVSKIRRYITEEAVRDSSTNVIPKGNLLVVTRTGVGKLSIAPFDVAVSQDFTGIIPNKKINHEFLFWLLNNSRNFFLDLTQGTSINGITRKDLMSYNFPLPPLPEQHRIAEILSTIDETIERTEALIEKYRHIKAGLMSDLLTRGIDEEGRIRSEETHEFKDSPLGRVPKGWEVNTLEDVCAKAINGGTPSTEIEKYWEGDIPWITGADILNQKVSKIRRYITEEAVRDSSTNVIPKGNLLVVTRTGVGKLSIAPFDVAVSQDFTGIIPNKKINHEFLFWLLNNSRNFFLDLTQGTSINGITRKDMMSYNFPLSSLPEQHRIAEILTATDTYIEKEQTYLNKLQQIKKGLMQDLLTGKVRVTTTPSPPKPAEAATCPT